MSNENGLDRLIEELQAAQTTTLAIVAGEGRAILRAHRVSGPRTETGWVLDLDCGTVLADVLQGLVGTAEASGPGRCQRLGGLGRSLVHVLITCSRADLLRQVVRAVVDDYNARRPAERVTALAQAGAHRAPRRIDLCVPPPAQPLRGRALSLPRLSGVGA